jgi:hypothetical protein
MGRLPGKGFQTPAEWADAFEKEEKKRWKKWQVYTIHSH